MQTQKRPSAEAKRPKDSMAGMTARACAEAPPFLPVGACSLSYRRDLEQGMSVRTDQKSGIPSNQKSGIPPNQ